MNPVVHFEMPAENPERMKKFYEETFGWKTEQMGPEFGDYIVVRTAESDPADPSGRPKEPGMINGGFYKKMDDPKLNYPSIVISVEDIRESMKKVTDSGGTLLGGMGAGPGEPDEIPGIGLYASFIDTEGNRVGMLQPAPMP